MSDTYGALYIQGQQINLPGGSQGIGQFAIPASGLQGTYAVYLSGTTPVATPVPEPGGTLPIGVLVIPPAGGTAGIRIRFNGNTIANLPINPQYPSWFAMDPGDIWTNVYLTSTSGTAVTVILQFV